MVLKQKYMNLPAFYVFSDKLENKILNEEENQMGLADTFGPEDRVTLMVSDLLSILRSDALNCARNQCLVNGVKAHLPYNHILIMVGEEPTQGEYTPLKREREEN